jgi:hypothetical protein
LGSGGEDDRRQAAGDLRWPGPGHRVRGRDRPAPRERRLPGRPPAKDWATTITERSATTTTTGKPSSGGGGPGSTTAPDTADDAAHHGPRRPPSRRPRRTPRCQPWRPERAGSAVVGLLRRSRSSPCHGVVTAPRTKVELADYPRANENVAGEHDQRAISGWTVCVQAAGPKWPQRGQAVLAAIAVPASAVGWGRRWPQRHGGIIYCSGKRPVGVRAWAGAV